MGRKAKPARLHEANGNPGHRDVLARIDAEPRVTLGKPKMPTWLNAEGRSAWRRLLACVPAEILAKSDAHALSLTADAWATLLGAKAAIEKHGMILEHKGRSYVNPAVRVAKDATAALLRLLPEFSLTPSGRARAGIQGAKSRGDDAERLMEFLGQKVG